MSSPMASRPKRRAHPRGGCADSAASTIGGRRRRAAAVGIAACWLAIGLSAGYVIAQIIRAIVKVVP